MELVLKAIESGSGTSEYDIVENLSDELLKNPEFLMRLSSYFEDEPQITCPASYEPQIPPMSSSYYCSASDN